MNVSLQQRSSLKVMAAKAVEPLESLRNFVLFDAAERKKTRPLTIPGPESWKKIYAKI